MYSSKENVNILTALLVKHGINHAVVCPGSRNAPIVHNLNECLAITCHPATDERSAAFYALGMAQATDNAVAVCVTSGTALLNVAPAVAEAYYQHQAIIVIAADRPQQWIDQLDGQTLPQPDALGRFVGKAVTLPEPTNDEERWYCNRLVNEALIEATDEVAKPVLINVPISEPLFSFDTTALPDERHIVRSRPATDYCSLHKQLIEGMMKAQRPMIVFGQANPNHYDRSGVDYLFGHVIVLHEQLSSFPHISHFDEVLSKYADDDTLLPDFIIHVGDAIVSKRLRHFLRRANNAVTWRISPSGKVEDSFMNLCGIVVGDEEFVLQALNDKLRYINIKRPAAEYRRRWLRLLSAASRHADLYVPQFSQMAAVKELESQIRDVNSDMADAFAKPVTVHYANSSAIRLANIYAQHHVWCNRGVNGIEGSLSTAAGFSVVSGEMVVCVIGDLSFFYDQNALWNKCLYKGSHRGNLRILLLNNGCGGIFSQLPGLEHSSAAASLVAAAHNTTAEGICRQNGVEYLVACDTEELPKAIRHLLTADSSRPILLEVVTSAAADRRAIDDYYSTLSLAT